MLKLFKAELPADPFLNTDGLYMLVLAVNLEQAKKYIQKEFDESYPSSLTVDVDPILIKEIEPPFKEGTLLCSFLYPNRTDHSYKPIPDLWNESEYPNF